MKNIFRLYLFFIALAFNGCKLNPKSVDLNEYQKVVDEIKAKKSLIPEIFHPYETSVIIYLTIKDFSPSAIATFPETYNLLKEKKSEEVAYLFSGDCIYFLLKRHESPVFTTQVECLKSGNSEDCDLTKIWCSEIKSETVLNRNWRYQIINQYFCE